MNYNSTWALDFFHCYKIGIEENQDHVLVLIYS